MIPSIVAWQLKKGTGDYIKSSFPISNPYFERAMDKLIAEDGSLYHEPYTSIKMPFRSTEDSKDYFESISVPYNPYLHQSRAFERLLGDEPKPTIIATGTGSGKTECFLYPILEYCYQHRNEKGIKALLIYPMNALATDQAKRIAELINSNNLLKNNVTVGMYVGGRSEKASKTMSEHDVITDHNTILQSPPSILMTNYKMLDYLLVRPKDAKLWNLNTERSLRFIVVDELHTFDGAQGTDLACLIRRLKNRLGSPQGYVCGIGTSATIGSKDSYQSILQYASEIFDTVYEDSSLILEDRITTSELLKGYPVEYDRIPNNGDLDILSSRLIKDDEVSFLKDSVKYWFEQDVENINDDMFRCKLSDMISSHLFFRDILQLTEGKNFQFDQLLNDLLPRYSPLSFIKDYETLLNSAIALISHARIKSGTKVMPFLSVHVELWLKELSRVVSKIAIDETEFASSFDLNSEQSYHYTPLVVCRDCGNAAWLSRHNSRNSFSVDNLDLLYNSFFEANNTIIMAYPSDDAKRHPDMAPGWICPECMLIYDEASVSDICPTCDCKMVHVFMPKTYPTTRKLFECPICHSKRGLGLFGFRGNTELSVCLSQLYSSRFNDDKKVISFTDNVQDAAHNASYFNFKTNRFILRNSIQEFADGDGLGLSLKDFSNNFVKYAHTGLSDEEFISTYIPPKLVWMRAYEQMKRDGYLEDSSDKATVVQYISNYLRYEILLEYGVESTTDRTLTTSCASTLEVCKDQIQAIASRLADYCKANIASLNAAPFELFTQLVFRIIDVMKVRGAFNASIFEWPVKDNNTYVLSRNKWMPGIRTGRNTPHFLCNTTEQIKKAELFDALSSPVYLRAIRKFLPDDLTSSQLSDIIKAIGLFAKEEGLLTIMPNDRYEVWAIDMNKVHVTNTVIPLECDCCGFKTYVAENNAPYAQGTPCGVLGCSGHLKKSERIAKYYQNLYRNADISRIHAYEHTGLLSRSKRESVESSFKRDGEERRPWDINLLSATPTLEMGIDVGSLSTTVMTSVPPGQSQYLQRSGRAGRRDGNSFNLVLSKNKPYDQYYYAEPLEMISGIVDCPRIFISASAVLERQFTAFCLDNWIKDDPKSAIIPNTLNVCINSIDDPDKMVFPHNFTSYVSDNVQHLFTSFIRMFNDRLDEDTISELNIFAIGDGSSECPMHMNIRDVFLDIKKERNSILDNIRRCKVLIQEIKKKPKDSSFEESINELTREQEAYTRVVQEIAKKNVFNFMSDEGILPNYAFPESGMILKAVLFRDRPEGAPPNTPADKIFYEYQRPSTSAITELAPNNTFCAEGHELSIDRIDMPTASMDYWRLCPNCSHIELNSMIANTSSCPHCGSVDWADRGQMWPMMKAKMVYSFGRYENSIIDDSQDNRKLVSYNRQTLVDVDEVHDIVKAYCIENDQYSFGYDFVKKATIREINFGKNSDEGKTILVAGISSKRSGFRICKHCGRVQPESRPLHTADCKYKNSPDESDYEECMFLYRELNTEALRVLIPTISLNLDDFMAESFVAAFMLGMREYFGNVDHLKATISAVPITEGCNKLYLVIYDSIPGGTGYLKQLMKDHNSLISILEKALLRLENCQCSKDPNKDGCYHCLYTYRQSRSAGLSRKGAISMLKTILSGKETLKEIDSLSKIEINGLFDSALEARFISILEDYCKQNRGSCSFKPIDKSGKKCYEMQISGLKWIIEPQFVVDKTMGVEVVSKPDFMIYPEDKHSRLKPVAVFTDGFQFHHYKAADDTLKRNAIILSGKFRVWSLSWKDVNYSASSRIEHAVRTLSYDDMPSPKMYVANVNNLKVSNVDPSALNAFELLMAYLGNEAAEDEFKKEQRHTLKHY